MPTQKRILILTESRGGKGHIMPATAITQALHKLYPHKHRVTVVNMGDESNFFLEDFLHTFYLFIFKHAPWLLKIYKISDNRPFMKSINNIYIKLNRKDIVGLYNKIKPDLVLSNYPAWDYAFYKALKQTNPEVPYVNLNTDSCYPHFAWLLADADYNIVADNDTKQLYMQRGKKGSKIKVLGIPVRQDVTEKGQKASPLKTPPKPPYNILFLPSSSNAKAILATIKPFEDNKEFNIEVVMGRSKTATEYIQSKISAKNVKVTGWTDEIAQKLDEAHIVITKPGGSTTQECIAMKKPMVINKVVPGQEEGNARLILKHRMGFVETQPEKIIMACNSIIKSYPQYQRRIAEVSSGNSAEKIAAFIDSIEA